MKTCIYIPKPNLAVWEHFCQWCRRQGIGVGSRIIALIDADMRDVRAAEKAERERHGEVWR